MITNESRVALTYNVGGALLSTREKEPKSGETIIKNRYSQCQIRINLDTDFVQNAVSVKEGRPDRNRYSAVFGRWFKMSNRQRLEWHLYNLVASRDGGGMKYEIV